MPWWLPRLRVNPGRPPAGLAVAIVLSSATACGPASDAAPEFRLVVHKDATVALPRGESPTRHLIMGLDTDLDRALRNATYEVVGSRPSEAFSVASAAGDFTISEAAGMGPKAIFPDPLRAR